MQDASSTTAGHQASPARVRSARIPAVWIAALLILSAILRLIPVYTTFGQTYDEPFHVAAGMEWLDKGAYKYELQHPPLARILVAAGPYLAGIRSSGLRMIAEGNAIFLTQGEYFRNLTLARIGNLPFLVLASIVVFVWGRRWFGETAAVFALLLFVCLPPILGHASLATTDIGATATIAAALFLFLRWLEEPGWPRAILLGLALGAAFATKFSSLAFLPPCFAAAAMYRWTAERKNKTSACRWTVRIAESAGAVLIALALVWITYRFELRPVSPLRGAHPLIDVRLQDGPLRHAAYRIVEMRFVPLLDFRDGIYATREHNIAGHDSYLFGQYRKTGWWYFFPVVLGVKTPLGFLILGIGSLAAMLLRRREYSWQQKSTALFPVIILAVCMASRIDLGVRHILPLYVPLAVLAGDAAARLARSTTRRIIPIAGFALVTWAVVTSLLAHPDYLAYFNELAARHPEQVLAESDLDWGQDLFRLSARLRALGVTDAAVKYFGSAPLDVANFPPHRDLDPKIPTSGYVAISLRFLELQHAKDGSYEWLRAYQPVERIGKSIFLYRIPGPSPP